MTDHQLQKRRISELRSALRNKNLKPEERCRLRNKLSMEIFEEHAKPQAHALPMTRDADDER
jgi:hypothetical protein